MYGTSKAALAKVAADKQVAILDIDIQGANQLKSKLKEAHYIFLLPPSFDILEARLRGRGTETEEKIQVRVKNAKEEIDFSEEPGFFELVFVVDDGLVVALPKLLAAFETWYPQLCK